MINRVVLVGRLTRDPELRRTASGNSVCSFGIAVDNRQKNPDGTRGTTFITCACFQQAADNMVKFTRKGALVGVEGRLNQRNFVRQDGSKGSVIEVLCDSVQFLEPKGNSEESVPVFDDQPVESTDSKNLDALDLPDDDLPF
ncbi:MAG: single-stranded DNA-binding protein [Bacilli bacterium]|nr:single-stranded DNA-binding protein [Bacilli bacterium]